MKRFVIFLSLILFFVSLGLVSADLISINGGGSSNSAITPDKNVEGFFFGAGGAICGNSIIETSGGEQCDDGNTVSGDGCSSTCQTEDTDTGDTGGGGGGGGGASSANIDVTPNNFSLNLAVNTNIQRTVSVTNLGSSSTTISISQSGLSGNIILNTTSITIPGGGTVDFDVTFVALNETGIFTGSLNVGGKIIPVTLNVATQLLLFDSNIVVLNDNYQVPQGNKLRTQVTLLPFGDPARLDVNLIYTIRDFSGKTYLTNSETLLVENAVDFNRNFGTGSLPVGQYVVGLELIYPNGVAPSSAQFEIVEREPITIFGKIVVFLLILILFVSILLIIVWIKRERDKNKPQTKPKTAF